MYDSVLIINSYAGSLLLAAKREGLKVLASLEDKGYGIGSQRLNFPDESYVDAHPWPEPGGSLEKALVIAHPPCACFSVQGANQDPALRGMRSVHFISTRKAVEYSLALKCAALAVESVIPTLEGARPYHDRVAKKFGYSIYRVLQNAITFGVPQWRPRFWCLFVRRDLAPAKLVLTHRFSFRTVGERLATVDQGAKMHYVERSFTQYREKLAARGINLDRVLAGGPGSLLWLVARHLGWEARTKSSVEYRVAAKFNFSKFSSAWPIHLDPGGFTPTLMATSHWWYEGRPLTAPEYNVLGGYPATYQFDKPREQQAYLSRGVAPAVAGWILRQLRANLERKLPTTVVGVDRVQALTSGEVADFRVKRAELKQRRLFNLEDE